jgi:hypothetical protein
MTAMQLVKMLSAAGFTAALLPLSVQAQALNPQVRPDNINSTICVAGWTKTVRPPVAYTNGIKRKLLREQGIPPSNISEFELDHVVPLALGGAPRSPANLKLQPWEGPDGAKKKDRIEVKLQCLVCSGQVPLSVAQREIGEDWQAAYRKYSRVKCHRKRR